MTPTEPGTYKMSGSVNIASDVSLDFKSQGLMKAKGMRWRKDGRYAEGVELNGPSIESFLRENS